MVHLQASTTVQHSDWISLISAILLAVVGTVLSVRVWKGEPANRRNSLQQERYLTVLKVAIAPTAVAFWAAAVGLLCLNLGGKTDGSAVDLVLFIGATLMGIICLVAIAAACSLFFFARPKILVPPSLR